MPLKKDKSRRAVEMVLELPGTPEEIWRLMATGPGYTAWFVPTTIEEREGGAVSFDLGGGMISPGTVTEWKPPHRFAYEEAGWSGEAPPLATQVTIEAKAGGSCVVRMVHSLFTERDDWDKEIEGMEKGWAAFFKVLRLYLEHFRGMPAAFAGAMGVFAGPPEDAWRALTQGLGLENASIGETRDTSVNGGPRLVGAVEDLRSVDSQRALTLRLTEPAPGVALFGTFAHSGQTFAPVSLYFYGAQADAVRAEAGPKWEAWMAKTFPPPAA